MTKWRNGSRRCCYSLALLGNGSRQRRSRHCARRRPSVFCLGDGPDAVRKNEKFFWVEKAFGFLL